MKNTTNTKAKETVKAAKTIIENPDVRVVSRLAEQRISDQIKNNIAVFRRYLHIIKKKCDKYDIALRNKHLSEKEIKRHYLAFILKEKERIFQAFDRHFSLVWNYMNNKLQFRESEENNDTYLSFKNYYQREILNYFMAFGLGKQAFYKPYGYPGDYKLIENYYSDYGNNPDLYGELLHNYTINTACGKAVRARQTYLLALFNKIEIDNAQVLSVGSGSAPEIIKYLEMEEHRNSIHFSLLDINQDALDFVKTRKENSKELKAAKMSFFQIDILKFMKSGNFPHNQDVIYSLGLFDYFNDKLFVRYAKFLFDNLNKNGELIIGNLSPEHPHRAYMTLLAEWHLVYRNKALLEKLAWRCGFSNYHVETDPTGIQLFLVVKKGQ